MLVTARNPLLPSGQHRICLPAVVAIARNPLFNSVKHRIYPVMVARNPVLTSGKHRICPVIEIARNPMFSSTKHRICLPPSWYTRSYRGISIRLARARNESRLRGRLY
jgi:hypothetical protein